MEPSTPIQPSTTPPLSPTIGRSQRRLGSPAASLRSPLLRSPELKSPRSQRLRYSLEPPEPPEIPEKRLVIRKLVLINYKSYAGRQEVGPFNESFTAVVGPNGSGKSNVIDSLLFVFGFRAKKMRQEKLTGLIHKSEAHPNLSFCRVEVHFAEVGVPDSDLILAREVRRDGGSFYSLNETRASYAQVQELLEQRGIDLRHKRFLILQGEVESIALMPAKAEGEGGDGLLEYLEDIIGTSNYKVRIEELDTEAEERRQECGEKQRRVDIVVKDLKKLETERAEIERWMLNANHAILARSKLLQLIESRLRNSLELAQGDINDQTNQIKSAEAQIGSKREQLSVLENGCNDNSKRLAELKKGHSTAQARLKTAQVALVKANQRRGQLEARKKKLERDLGDAQLGRSRSAKSIEDAQNDLTSLHEKLEGVKRRDEEAQVALGKVRQAVAFKTTDIQAELSHLQAQADPWRVRIADKELKIAEVNAETAAMQTAHDESETRVKKADAVAKTLQEEGRITDTRVKECEKVFSVLTEEATKVDMAIPEVESTVEQVKRSLEQLRPEVAQARESRAASQTQNRVERKLLSLKISGLYGRLGSLGSIDQQYDVAVSTAGPELNNFVVDTVETAKVCIKALRQHSIGRAKFIVLDKLSESPPSPSGDQLPAPRLLDLVKPVDPQFGKAFYAALGDTLVVPSIEEANRVAFNSGRRRHRVVTLNGVVVNVSGQMSGGGKPLRGLMAKVASSVSAEDLERIEKQVAACEFELAEAVQQLNASRSRSEELRTELSKAQMALDKEQMSLKQVKSQFALAREKRREVREEAKLLLEKLETTKLAGKERITVLRTETNELESQSRSLEEKIQGLQKRILDAGGTELRELSSLVRDCEIEDQETRQYIEEKQEQVAQHQSRVRKFDLEIETFERELADFRDGVKEEVQPESIADLEAHVQALSSQIASCTLEMDQAKAEIAEIRLQVDEYRAAEVGAQNVLDGLRVSTHKMRQTLEETLKRRASLQLHDVSMARSLSDDSAQSTSSQVKTEEGGDDSMSDHHAAANDVTGLPDLSPDEIDDLDEAELKAELARCERTCENANIDMEVLGQYRSRHAEFLERKSVSDEAVAIYERVKAEVQRLRHRRYTEFMDGFLQISAKLKEMYQLLTMGGNAELELVDTMDPFAEGILFSVMPPKKSWRNIANLSGGEKTLSSLALVFALHHYKPTPLYVMDEIDAALDFRNVSIIANYIKERTRNGQFIVISLRNNMFELASRLVGVYKVNNMTSSVTLQTE